jgi:amino acid transporter
MDSPFASPHDLTAQNSTRWNRFKDSFKPAQQQDPHAGSNVFVHRSEIILDDEKELTDIQKAAINSSRTQLKQRLLPRHLAMFMIGGTIGAGLFVNSGAALNTGGPAALIIGWCTVATLIFVTLVALTELSVTFPVTGGFLTHSTRFLDPSLGFAIAWTYMFQWMVALPLMLVGAAITIRFWRDDINADVWVVVFYVFIFILNMLHVKHYAESEVILAAVKLLAIAGFFILGIVLICGGGPQGGYIGGRYWHDPGAFANGFKGVCSVFVTAAFSFAGVEIISMTAAETEDPRNAIPIAAKRTFWLITLSYIVTLILIGCLVPYNDPSLWNGSSLASISPFVIAIRNAGIRGLPSVMNVVILFALLSVANTSVYATSRVLASMGDIGHAPSIVSYVDRTGRPLVANLITFIFGLIAFCAASDKEDEIFTWLSALTSLSTIFAWIAICLSHIRFRQALSIQGRSTNELSYVAPLGIWGSLYGVIANFVVIMGQFWVALFPDAQADATSFFEVFLSLCIVIVFYVGHKFWKKNWYWWIKPEDMDIDTGRKHFDIDLLKQEIIYEKERIGSSPLYYRIYKILC